MPQQFTNAILAQRYQALLTELRCPKCENQNLANSNAPIAADMRHFIAQALSAGMRDQQIRQALIDRFGEYVLYKPRFEARTWVLWLLPIFMLMVGLLLLSGILYRQHIVIKQHNKNSNH